MKFMNNSWAIRENSCSLRYIFIAFVFLCSCSTSRITNHASRIASDTIYISNVKHDSVYLNHERFIDRSKDTVYIKDVSLEYKYRVLRDTILKVRHDSVPYEVVRIETKETTRPLTWYDHLTRTVFWFVIGSLLTLIVFKLKKHLRIIYG